MRYLGMAVLAVSALMMPFSSGHAVSFDCSNASNMAEYIVCSNPALSDLDDRLSAAYATARHDKGSQNRLLLDQRAWIVRRYRCRTTDCVNQLYRCGLPISGAQIFFYVPPALAFNGGLEVPLVSRSGTLTVPVLINNAITLDFIIDSGASDVSIPADVVMTLIRTGTISDDDFLGDRTYTLADGSTVLSKVFRIRSLRVGSKVLQNVIAGISPVQGALLLGQSILSRFQSWSINNNKKVLILE